MKSFCLAYEEFLPCIYKYAPIASTRHILLRHSEDSEKSLCTFDLSLRLYCDYARLIYKFTVPCNGALFGIAGDPTMLNGMSTSVLITACLSDGRATAHTLWMLKVHIVAWSSRQPYYK